MNSKHLPGLALAAAIAVAGRLASGAISIRGAHPVSDVTIAIAAGLAIRNLWPAICPATSAGATFAVKRLLRAGIVMLGFGLPLGAVLTTGASSLAIIVAVVAVSLLFTRWLGRVARCRDKLATLIAVGTGICGATAIVTAAPVIGADDDDVCYAVAVISVFGMLAIFAYPLIGFALGLADRQFGAWAGLAVHDTAQVVAAGFAFSEAAGRIATVVKLTRTALLAPLVLVLASMYRRPSGQAGQAKRIKLGAIFPWFIVGFLATALVRSLGDAAAAGTAAAFAWAAAKYWVGYGARLMIVTAMAGVGLSTGFESFRSAGLKPMACGLAASVVVGVAALGLILAAGF
jgi:uncharacterized integral membrane protein (TIGR00698 family)